MFQLLKTKPKIYQNKNWKKLKTNLERLEEEEAEAEEIEEKKEAAEEEEEVAEATEEDTEKTSTVPENKMWMLMALQL